MVGALPDVASDFPVDQSFKSSNGIGYGRHRRGRRPRRPVLGFHQHEQMKMIWHRVKLMKKIVCILLVVGIMLLLCACGNSSKNPFENLKDDPSYSEAKKRYGDDVVKKTNGFGMLFLYYSYPWHDCNGELKIEYTPDFVDKPISEMTAADWIPLDYYLTAATWTYSGHDLAKVRDNIVSQMESSLGKADKTGSNYKWEDSTGKYSLYYTAGQNEDTVEFDFKPKI